MTIQAIAVASGFLPSVVDGGKYTIYTATPVFSPAPGSYAPGQTVSLSDANAGAVIYYTLDGSTPSASSTRYAGPITLSEATTINAIALASGFPQSAVSSATYEIGRLAATPTFSPTPGNYSPSQFVSLSDATPGAVIYYTLDGSTPDQNANLYTGPFTISGITTVSAIAMANSYFPSLVASATYNTLPQADAPTFSPLPGTYLGEQWITLADTAPNATIYYTWDGSTPTTSSLQYTVPILITRTRTIHAMAVADGYSQSSVASGTFTTLGVLRAAGNEPVSLPATAVGSQAASQDISLSFLSSVIISGISVPPLPGGTQEFVVGTVTGCAVDGVTMVPVDSVCTVPVTFKPAYPGLRQAPLVVQTNLGAFKFGIEGVGQAPQLGVIPGVITTAAGTSVAGYDGDGGPAVSTEFSSPQAVTADAAGNLYIADSANNRVRKVDAVTKNVSTVAGTGIGGYSGDGGAATSARLDYPYAVAVDAAGNLYIADSNNNVVRRVDAATGVITTVAGDGSEGYGGDDGAATQAQLDTPSAVAVDAGGNLYIADSSNGCLRVVSDTGVISTAYISNWLSYPTGVAVDTAGNVYVADQDDNTIYKMNAAGNSVTWLGTTGVAVAVDAAANVYISNDDDNVIYKIDAATGAQTIVAGVMDEWGGMGDGDGGPATSADLWTPAGLTVDAAGNLDLRMATAYARSRPAERR